MTNVSTGGYTKPNYTQIPNTLLDVHMPNMKEAELRIVLAIARATFGWHKTEDKLSISQLMERTGLTRQGVVNGIQAGVERGVIVRHEDGMGFVYSLVVDEVVNEVDQSTKLTSQPNRPEVVNEVDQKQPKLVNEVDTQKKDIKEKKKSSAKRQSSKTTDADAQEVKDDPTKELVKQILAAYVEVRGKNGINYGKEGAWAKRIAKEHTTNTVELVKGCYLWLKKDKFYEFKPVPLAKVYENLPEFLRYLESRNATIGSNGEPARQKKTIKIYNQYTKQYEERTVA